MPPNKKSFTADQAAARTLATGLSKLPENWVMCRDMRHAWAVHEDFHVEPSQTVGRRIESVRRVLACMRCNTFRVEHYSKGRYGLDKTSQYYQYPENYQMPGVPRGVKPQSIIQQEQYRRAMEKAANAEKGQSEGAER